MTKMAATVRRTYVMLHLAQFYTVSFYVKSWLSISFWICMSAGRIQRSNLYSTLISFLKRYCVCVQDILSIFI